MIGLKKIKGNIFTVKVHEIVLGGKPENFTSLFIVMDYMQQDLGTMMRDKDLNLGFDHALIILYNLLCALNMLTTAELIHRDIKPQNILVT